MKFNLNSQPDDIVLIVADGEVITLKHVFLTSTERATVLELLEESLSASMSYLYDKIIAWSGVENESGSPMPLHRGGDSGKLESNLDRVFGLLPIAIHIEAWIKQLVMNGVPLDKLMNMARQSLTPEQIESVREVAGKMGKTPALTDGAS